MRDCYSRATKLQRFREVLVLCRRIDGFHKRTYKTLAEYQPDTIRTFGIKGVVKTLTLSEILNQEDDEAEIHAKPDRTSHE